MPTFLDPLWIMSLSVFGLAAIAAGFGYETFYEATRRRRVARRLANGRGGRDSAAPLELRRGRRMSNAAASLTDLTWLRRLVAQSGLDIRLRMLGVVAASAAGALALALAYWLDPLIAVAVGATVGGLAPLLVLRFLRGRRRRRFGEQFPEAIDIIVRSLRAGHPIAIAIKTVAGELPAPTGPEFAVVQDEITYGLDLESAMRNLSLRVGQEDLPLFVTAISIQSQTGGNLTEVLGNLGDTIRQRIKLQRKVRALSSEGKVSAIILGAVPFVLFAAVNVITPNFYGAYWGHPWIKFGLSGAVGWMLIGFAIMRKMINFRT